MQLCFDATRFGCGLQDAVAFAVSRQLAAIEYSIKWESSDIGADIEAGKISDSEKEFLDDVKRKCLENNVEIACLNLDYCFDAQDSTQGEQFVAMVKKLAAVSKAVGCSRLAFWFSPGIGNFEKISAEKILKESVQVCAEENVKLLLRLSVPKDHRGKSLRLWRPLDLTDWRELITSIPGLCFSFSPADCVWLGIDYLQILPAFIAAIEMIEANDVEINNELLKDSGLFGPLWWRYRMPGKGQLDWRQFLEALKLYDFRGIISLHLDDEFVDDSEASLERALDLGLEYLAPLVRG